ncbi:MAG TPA: tetratricopeptide repeat protein [Terracidiphilus sp.]|nr:tetratricopeptide repeat protein [Terracidiphilus sp.]
MICSIWRHIDDWSRRESRIASGLAAALILSGVFAASSFTAFPQTTARNTKSTANELEHARRLLDTAQWRDAEGLVKTYLDTHSESADGHALMGLILYREHQPRASMAEYLRASESADLTAFDLRIFALDCAAIPDLPEAERWLERSLQKDERDPATWEALGHVRFAAQKYEGAIDALHHALQLAPHTISSETLIGVANERLAKPDAAEAAYKTAIAWQAGLKIKDPVPYIGMGRVLLANNQTADAIPYLQQAVKAPQAPSEAHELLGLAYSRTSRNAEAAAEIEKAIQLDPQTARLHLMLARVYRSLGEKDKADAEQTQYAALKASTAQ